MSHKGYNRSDRVAQLVHHEVANTILRNQDNPAFKGVTITAVKMSRDLSYAKIYVTILESMGGSNYDLDSDDNKAAMKNLNREISYFRQRIAKNLNLRIVPDLRFYYDVSISTGTKLSAMIDAAVASDEARKHHEE